LEELDSRWDRTEDLSLAPGIKTDAPPSTPEAIAHYSTPYTSHPAGTSMLMASQPNFLVACNEQSPSEIYLDLDTESFAWRANLSERNAFPRIV
jgi:hypothetical protein